MPANSDAGIYAFPADLMNEGQSHYILFDIFSEEFVKKEQQIDQIQEQVPRGDPLLGAPKVRMRGMSEEKEQERVVSAVQVHQSQTIKTKLSPILE